LLAPGVAALGILPGWDAFNFELTKLCSFTEVGTYGVVVTREIWSVSNRPPFVARSASLPV